MTALPSPDRAASPMHDDVHGGATTQQHAATFTGVFGALTAECQRFGLRPSTVSVSALFGLVSASVGLPGDDTAGVDDLAGAYGLPPAEDIPTLYSRRGQAVIGGVDALQVHLDVYTSRPTVPAGVAVAAVQAAPTADGEPTRDVPAVAAPVRVPSERAVMAK